MYFTAIILRMVTGFERKRKARKITLLNDYMEDRMEMKMEFCNKDKRYKERRSCINRWI